MHVLCRLVVSYSHGGKDIQSRSKCHYLSKLNEYRVETGIRQQVPKMVPTLEWVRTEKGSLQWVITQM